jgi:hypothetical protein
MLSVDFDQIPPRSDKPQDTPASVNPGTYSPPLLTSTEALAWQGGHDACRWLEHHRTQYARPSQYRHLPQRPPANVVSMAQYERSRLSWWRRLVRWGR